MQIGNSKLFLMMTFRALTFVIRSDGGLTLETSAF